jgi:hemolysin III
VEGERQTMPGDGEPLHGHHTRLRDRLREPFNGLSHAVAALAALVGLAILLIAGRDDAFKQASLLVYGASLVLMLSSSAAYHLVKSRAEVTLSLRKLDHAAIYLLIAGTYTPICFNLMEGFWRWGMLGIIWGLALVGVVSKLFLIGAPRGFTAGVYLGMGWLSMLSLGELLRVMPAGGLAWLFLGGAAYTLGSIVYITKKMDFFPGVFGFHEVWHIFVILGCLFHYLAILLYVAPVPAGA